MLGKSTVASPDTHLNATNVWDYIENIRHECWPPAGAAIHWGF